MSNFQTFRQKKPNLIENITFVWYKLYISVRYIHLLLKYIYFSLLCFYGLSPVLLFVFVYCIDIYSCVLCLYLSLVFIFVFASGIHICICLLCLYLYLSIVFIILFVPRVYISFALGFIFVFISCVYIFICLLCLYLYLPPVFIQGVFCDCRPP